MNPGCDEAPITMPETWYMLNKRELMAVIILVHGGYLYMYKLTLD